MKQMLNQHIIANKISPLFTVNVKDKVMTCEMSDLSTPFQPLYNDACDEGIKLESSKTGNVSYWYVDEVVYSKDEDHELQYYILKPINESLRKHPRLKSWKLLVFND